MRSLCYLALVALASLARVQPVESRDQSTIDNAVNYLSESFEELKKYGLGVEALQTEYSRTSYSYSSLESDFVEELSTMSDALTVTEAIRDIVNAIGDIEPSCSSNEEPPLCGLSFGSSVTGCCYGCNDTMSSENADMFYCFADGQIRIAGSRLRDVEVLVGLEEEGQLLLFPPSTMNNYSDPRLMSWYSQSTLEPREVVIFLDINTNGLNGPSAVNELKDAAISLIESLEPRDKVGVIVTGNIRQRVCPDTFVDATEREKQELTTRLIRDELLTVNLDYVAAFQAASSYFNTSSTPSSNRYFIFLSDGRRTSFNGAQFLNINDVTNLIYTANDAVNNDLFSNNDASSLRDIGGIWSQFVDHSSSVIISTEPNSKGALSISFTSSIIRNNSFEGVITARLPWKRLLSAFDAALYRRPSSYYFVINRAGNFLYHSNYPNTSVLSIDPFVIEGNTTEFRYIRNSVINGQNESMPFNNTVLVPSSNESYYIRYVPSTYHCQLIINYQTSIVTDDIFICFVLADEDQSFIDMFNIIGSSVSNIYSSDQSRLPIYQTTLSSLSNKCNYVCQYSSNTNIVLQMTTPNAPPNMYSLLNFDEYISGTSQSTPSWLKDGISSEIAVHSAVSSIWLNNATNISAPIIRRYLTTPTGIFLSYPGINIDPSFTPRGLPWYPNAISFPDLLTLSYAQTDNTLYPNAQTYSISTALRVNTSVASIVAADLTMESLNNLVSKSLGSFCTQPNNECTVLTSEGYFVLLPPDINQPTLPFHLTDHEPYNGITRTLLERGVLVKEGCNVINDNTIIHRRFYSIRSVSSTMSCFIASRGCRDFCIKQITGTNSYLLISYTKSSCLSGVFSFCTTDCTDCTNTYSILSIECPCICGQTTCQIPSYGNLPVCPASSTLPPANYHTVLPDTTAGNGSFCFDDQCSKLSESSCQSSLSCNWCSQQSICVPLGICCTGDTSCCSNTFARYPSCIRNKCLIVTTPSVTATPSSDSEVQGIIIGSVLGGIFGIILLLSFIGCCVWYQFFRTLDPNEPKPKNDFDFDDVKVKSTNQVAMELEEKDIEKEKDGNLEPSTEQKQAATSGQIV